MPELSPRPHDHGPAATIAATATAVPEHLLTRESVKTYMRKVFDLDGRRLDAMMTVIDNAQVSQRHSIFPVEYFVEPRPLQQTSLEYQEHAVRLGRQAAEQCLAAAATTPADVDMIITVSCTGFMIPSLDAHLINLMGFRSNVRRLPITELGCAAGAVALTRAWEFVRAFPGKTALIVAVELATLTFQRGDLSQANLISCVLFGDGAAAALVTGRDAATAHRYRRRYLHLPRLARRHGVRSARERIPHRAVEGRAATGSRSYQAARRRLPRPQRAEPGRRRDVTSIQEGRSFSGTCRRSSGSVAAIRSSPGTCSTNRNLSSATILSVHSPRVSR